MALYKQVVQDIREHIESGALAPGQRISSIQELCERYSVSQITIRAALRELVTSGYLESRRRAGIFVRERRQDSTLMGGNVIALLVTAVQNPFFAEIIRGAEEEARAGGFRLVIANSNNEPELEIQQVRELAGQVAGLIIAPVTGSANYAAYLTLLERNVPFVFIDRYVEKLAVPVIATDNEYGGYIATRHVLDTGVSRMYIVAGRGVTSVAERITGYRRALKDAGVPYDPAYMMSVGKESSAEAYVVTHAMLKKMKRKDRIGIFTVNEDLARGCYAAIKEAGLTIPGDVAVVGFDDITGLFMDPPLTSVRQRMAALGSSAVKVLLDSVKSSGSERVRNIRLAPELIVRNSTDASSAFSLGDHLVLKSIGDAAPAAMQDVSDTEVSA